MTALTPRISILLPYRDSPEHLLACAASIAAQQFQDYEVLAVNDASAPESRSALAQAVAGDPRWTLIDNPRPGLVNALNLGLARCRAPLTARMDSDDQMHPHRLGLQYQAFQADGAAEVLGCRVRATGEHVAAGLIEYLRWQNSLLTPEQIARDIYVEAPFAHPSVMFRRSIVLSVGGYRFGDFPEDYDLWLRLHRAGVRMAKLPQVLLDWQDRPDRLSRSDPRCAREAFDRLRAPFLMADPRFVRRRDHFVIWGAGRRTRLRCRHLLALGPQPAAWIDIDPRKIGNRIDGIDVLAPDALPRIGNPFVLAYVANHGARDRIAAALVSAGYTPGLDFLQVG